MVLVRKTKKFLRSEARRDRSLFKRVSARPRKAILNTLVLKAPKAQVRMKWAKNYQLTQDVVDVPTSQIFRYTSLFDPDFTSPSLSDHQPWSYDTYSTLYKHYMVTAVHVKITAYAENDNVIGLFLTNSAVSAPANLSNYTQHMENPATSGGIVSTQDGLRVFKKTYNKNKVYGITQNANLTGLMGGIATGTNTDEEYFLIVSVLNVIPGELANAVTLSVELSYDCELTENKTLATS